VRRVTLPGMDNDLTFLDEGDGELWADEREAAPVLSLAATQRAELAMAVQAGLLRDGCDNTLRAARRWAAAAGLRWPPLREELEGNGGYCDCEVIMNVLEVPPEPD
jgi:Protein of unknown function (DUF2695)